MGDGPGEEGEDRPAKIADLLQMFTAGEVTVLANGVPLAVLDADSRSLGIEAKGLKQSGLKASMVIEAKGGGMVGFLRGAESLAKKLSENGWSVTLYDGGEGVLTMGRGVSRLTGYVRASPMKLGKILKTI